MILTDHADLCIAPLSGKSFNGAEVKGPVDLGTGQLQTPITLNATIVGLTFLLEGTLGRPAAMAKMYSVRSPKTLPVILNKEELTRLHRCRLAAFIDGREATLFGSL
jgi:hypothetical protein